MVAAILVSAREPVMRRFSLCVLILGLSVAGCGSDTASTVGPVDLDWPPDATAHFDQYGILNADCATDEDCAMMLGYYHSFDRFVQMDIRRRFSTGRLADILPTSLAGLLADDFADLRALFSTRDGVPAEEFLYDQSSPKTKALLDAYAVGVNKWISDMQNGENGAEFPRELMHRALVYSPEDVPPWEPTDSVAAVLALIENLTNDDTAQIRAAAAREAIDDDAKFSDLWSRRPLEESSILPLDWVPPQPPDAAEKRLPPDALRRPALRERIDIAPVIARLHAKLERTIDLRTMILGPGVIGDEIGSNNWVLAPSRTSAGNALLSNDPHLGMTQPATWYLAHLDAVSNGRGEIHAAGMTFAGLPWVLIGQNESIAWGLTTANMDFSDIYVETLVKDGNGSPTGVIFKGEEVPFLRVPFEINFSDGTSDTKELLFVPHHGSVREIDGDNNTAITLRWTGNDVSTDINFLTDLTRAGNLAEAKTALANITTLGQCIVVIDSENNIGWFPYSRVPKRTWATNLQGDAPPWLPLDGGGDYEWDQYFALEELPQAENPDSGYIATANNDMTGSLFDGDPTTLPNGSFHPPYQVGAAAGFRHQQITNLIEDGGNEHTRATMDAIISDVYSLIGSRMVPKILDLADSPDVMVTPEGRKVLNALEAWDYTCPTGLDGTDSESSPLSSDSEELLAASGCMAFHALLNELRFHIEKNENAPGTRAPSFAMYYSIVDPTQLAAGDIYWDDPSTVEEETRGQVMTTALDVIGNFLTAELGADETEWAWGRLHGLRLLSDLNTFGIFDFDNPAPGDPLYANDGGLFTVDVANPGLDDFVQTAGPSTRMVCESSTNGPVCTVQLPGGQSGDIDSPSYEDLLFPYLANESMPLLFDIDEANANAVRTVRFN
jgi:penicillin amidase